MSRHEVLAYTISIDNFCKIVLAVIRDRDLFSTAFLRKGIFFVNRASRLNVVVLASFMRERLYSEFPSVPSMSRRWNLSSGRYDGLIVTTVGLSQWNS